MPIRTPKTSFRDLYAAARSARRPGFLAPGPGADEPDAASLPDPLPQEPPSDLSPETRSGLRTLRRPAPLVAPAATAPTPAPGAVAPAPGARVRISVTARYPAEGWSRTFDAIAAVYGAHKAMRIVVRKALDAYEATPAWLPASATPPGYPARATGRLSSTRQIDGAVYAATQRIVDPMGLLSARAVDTLLVTAALTAFFAASDAENNSDGT